MKEGRRVEACVSCWVRVYPVTRKAQCNVIDHNNDNPSLVHSRTYASIVHGAGLNQVKG